MKRIFKATSSNNKRIILFTKKNEILPQKSEIDITIENIIEFENFEIWKEPKEITVYNKVIADDGEEYKRIHLIHWYFKDRNKLELSSVEKFHFSMLYLSDFDCKFDEIYFSVALDNVNNEIQKEFVKNKIAELTKYGTAKVDISFIQNYSSNGELDTWLRIFDFTYDRPDKCLLFYSHFKGIKYDGDLLLNVKYWSYLMYQGCLIDGWNNSQISLKNNGSYGALINNISGTEWIKECRNVINLEKYVNSKEYSGTFYWSNLTMVKKEFTCLTKKEYKCNFLSERMSVILTGSIPMSYFSNEINKNQWYNMLSKNVLPLYIEKFKNLYSHINKKTAIVAISSKSEDIYIDEWIKYHLSIGVDKIIIYTDKWNLDTEKYFGKVISIRKDSGNTGKSFNEFQLSSYNESLQKLIKIKYYKYCLFIDIDEFFTFREKYIGKKITEILDEYNNKYNFKCLQLPWKMFGDNNMKTIINNNYSIIDRFTKCAKDFGNCGRNNYYKCVLNLENLPNDIIMVIHDANCEMIIQNGNKHSGPSFNENFMDDDIMIYFSHFYCKTKEEFINNKTQTMNSVDYFGNFEKILKDRFDPLWNKNEIDNFDVLNIKNYYGGGKNKNK